MNALHFGTSIRFVSPERLRQHKPTDQSLISDDPFKITDCVSLKRKGYTESAHNCSIIALHNKKEMTLAHLNPSYLEKDKRKIIGKLWTDISTLQKNSDSQIHALITGGYSFKHISTQQSKKLFQLLIESLRLANPSIPIALLWGIKDPDINGYNGAEGGMDLICNAEKDEILLSNKLIPPYRENIRKAFRFIHIPKGDRFEVEPPILDLRYEAIGEEDD